MTGAPFWERKALDEMTRDEWESLCDGCARCCLIKLRDEDTDVVLHTRVACRLLDQQTCRCTDYGNRSRRVPQCVTMTADHVSALDFLPTTCAYRRLAEGRGLAPWHPLRSGDPDSVHTAGISIRGRVVGEDQVDAEDLEDHVIHWVELETDEDI